MLLVLISFDKLKLNKSEKKKEIEGSELSLLHMQYQSAQASLSCCCYVALSKTNMFAW